MGDYPIMKGILALHTAFLNAGVVPQFAIHVNHQEFMLLIEEALHFGYPVPNIITENKKSIRRVTVVGMDVIDDEGGV